jgi:hypothetical protein
MSLANPDPVPTASKILLGLLFVLLALSVLTQANPGTRLPARDYGFYVYTGEQILHGKLPYRDAWESKPPAIFYVNALALWIGRGSRWGIWIVEFFSLLAGTCFSYMAIRKLWGPWAALGGVIVWLLGLNLTLQGGNLTEEYPLSLHFLSILLFLELIESPRRYFYNFLLGLAFGLCFLFRPNNAAVETALILTLLAVCIKRRDVSALVKELLWLGCGALLPVMLTGLYFWSQGLWQELLEASILYNLSYSETQLSSTSPLKAGFTIFGWAAWVAATGYLLAGWQAIKRGPYFPVYLFLLIGFPVTIYLSDPARRSYEHYFMNWLPFLALLSGLVVHFLVSRLSVVFRDSARWNLAALSAALFLSGAFFFLGGPSAEYQKAIERIVRREAIGIEIRTRTAIYAENHTQPGELVLFWAASPGENFMANRESPSAYLFYPLYVDSPISARMNDQFLQDIITQRPVLIVDIGDHEALSLNAGERAGQIEAGLAWKYLPENIGQFFEFVEENYYLEAQVGDRAVYRLRDTPPQ